MRARMLLALLSLLSLLVQGREVLADKRVALVIGNSTYCPAPELPNPVNDASAVALLLRSVGFARDFSDQVRDAERAIVFFVGHGIEVDANYYLIPVKSRGRKESKTVWSASCERALAAWRRKVVVGGSWRPTSTDIFYVKKWIKDHRWGGCR